MKLFQNWIACIWVILGALLPPATFAYDSQQWANDGYDGTIKVVLCYDGDAVLSASESTEHLPGSRVIFFDFVTFLAAEGTAPTLGSLTPSQARTIQAFSDRFGAEVSVVGSRAAGTAGPLSDFDYVIGGNSSLRNSAGYIPTEFLVGPASGKSRIACTRELFVAGRH